MSSLSELRGEIDALDSDLRRLLERRCALATALAEVKSAAKDGGSIIRPAREAAQARALADDVASVPLPALLRIWRELIGASVARQFELLGAEPLFARPETASTASLYFGAALDYTISDDLTAICDALVADGRGLALVTARDLPIVTERGLAIVARLAEPLAPVPIFCLAPHADEIPETAATVALCLAPAPPNGARMLAEIDGGYLCETPPPAPDGVRLLARYVAPILVVQ